MKPKYDDWGFDPRDGGKIGKQHVPKWRPVSKQVRKALKGKLGGRSKWHLLFPGGGMDAGWDDKLTAERKALRYTPKDRPRVVRLPSPSGNDPWEQVEIYLDKRK